jgi:hypothetical protein
VAKKRAPLESLVELRSRLDLLPKRSKKRAELIEDSAKFYGVSMSTLRRMLRERSRIKSITRADYDQPRVVDQSKMERFCQVIAAIKVRTCNKKGRHLSTPEAIRLLEEHGVETPSGLLKAPIGLLKRATVNRYLSRWEYDHKAIINTQPTVVRFQAENSNDCWQFDMSYSDLKSLEEPLYEDTGQGTRQLLLFSVVDDRSGACYQEYRYIYGEDAASALHFLFNAMAPKKVEGFLFQGIPKMIYLDNGPVAKSRLFNRVMDLLGVTLSTHLPDGKDGRRKTARSKGKVERPFRTVKELHETLYHFHKPQNEQQANEWLTNYLVRYNSRNHRTEPHSRLEDWRMKLPSEGFKEMCSWERFCNFAREPEKRKVRSDATVSVDGVAYQVAADFAGQEVTLFFGIFDQELYVESKQKRGGPYFPSQGPIPLHRYRQLKKTMAEKRADAIGNLAKSISIPKEALSARPFAPQCESEQLLSVAFVQPDLFNPLEYASPLEAKRAVMRHLGKPLAKLSCQQREVIDSIVKATLNKEEVQKRLREGFEQLKSIGERVV